MEPTEFQRDDHKERSIAYAKAIAAAVYPGGLWGNSCGPSVLSLLDGRDGAPRVFAN